MLKSQGQNPAEREKLLRREREKISKVPGKVESEKRQGTDGEMALLREERHLFSCNRQKGREMRSRCRKVRTAESRKLREFRSDGCDSLCVVGGKVTCFG